MSNYRIDQLINIQQIENLLEAHVRISGIACGLMDNDGNIIVSAGMQPICTRFLLENPESFARCWRNDPDIKRELHAFSGDLYECCCKNGMVNIAMPIVIEGNRLAVFFSGQFFYADEPPDLIWFRQQAEELGFDIEPFLTAVREAPRFSRAHVDNTMRFLHQLVQLLAETGHTNLMRERDLADRKRQELSSRQSEEKFRTLAEHSPDSIVRYDTNCRMIYINPRMEKTLGMSSANLLGRTPIEKPSGTERTEYLERIKQVLVTGEEGEIDLVLPDTGEGERHHNIRFIAERDSDGSVIGILAIGRDITERKQAEQKLREKQQHLNDMALELTLSEVRERRRIAVDLHDTLGQDLTLTRMKLGGLNKTMLLPEQQKIIAEIKGLTENAIHRVRRLTRLLSPPIMESAGLEAALKWLARQLEADYCLQIAFSDDLQDKPVAREIQMELYNSVRELLINVAKHAETSTACLSVCREADTLAIKIEDDGVGFDVDTVLNNPGADGFGLFTISRRITHIGGVFQITSKPGSGTEVAINVPLAQQATPETTTGEQP